MSISIADVNKAFSAVPELANNGSNYQLWLARVTNAARTLGDTKLITDAPTTTNKTLAERFLGALLDKLQSRLFMLVQGSQNPKEALDDLKLRFGQTTASTLAHAERQLFTMKCTSDRDVLRHLDDLERQHDQLADMGRTIDSKTYRNVIISSVPDHYRPICDSYISSVETLNELGKLQTGWTPVDVDNDKLMSKIRQEALTRNLRSDRSNDTRHERKDKDKSSDRGNNKPKNASANAATPSSSSRPKPNNRRQPRRTNAPKSDNPSDWTCYRCQGKGHKANQCPSPKEISGRSAEAQKPKSEKAKAPQPKANTATIEEVPDQDWSAAAITISDDVAQAMSAKNSDIPSEIYDTGASRHMSPYH